jgi:hypothetical protein
MISMAEIRRQKAEIRLCDWKTTSPNGLNVFTGHAHKPVAKRQHRALQMEKWPMKARVCRAKSRIIWDGLSDTSS